MLVSQSSTPEQLPEEGLEIIRNRIFINHSSPINREITDEITILNNSKESKKDIFLETKGFMPGLRVLDYDGSEIGYLPNEYMKALASSLAPKSAKWKQIRDDLQSRKKGYLWLRVPDGKEIKPTELRVIKLQYLDNENPSFVRKSLFSIPRYTVEKIITLDEMYDTFYVIKSPEGFTINYKILEKTKTGEGKSTEMTKQDRLYIDKTEDHISARIPDIPGFEVRVKMNYDILLNKGERWVFRLFWSFLLAISLGFVLLEIATMAAPAISFKINDRDIIQDIVQLIDQSAEFIAGAIRSEERRVG